MGWRADPMTPKWLTDPEAMAALGTPEARYAAAFAREGTGAFITNATSQMLLLRHGARCWPVTVDDGGYGRSYVASPHSAYVLYAREEMDIVGMTKGRWAAGAALSVLDRVLRHIDFNRAAHIDNWMLSTNLHDGWDGTDLPAIRAAMAQRWPDHFLVLRSLDAWSCPKLLEAARADGWMLLPARQIWVVDDLARDWRPRKDYANDRRALARSGFVTEGLTAMTSADAARIAALYHQLYIGRYSALNPVFTPDFIQLTAETGVCHYRVARAPDGLIMAVAGMVVRGDTMTTPVVGYDTTRPQSEALYRIACFMLSDWAMERGLKMHGSAGAASFKRNRGAHGVIEYMAVQADHLSPLRRRVVQGLAALFERWIVPMMQKEGW
jgi:hypothetical protein